ncbi:MAG: EF-hand domain-containing protein [Planctomycetaceae bacterium]
MNTMRPAFSILFVSIAISVTFASLSLAQPPWGGDRGDGDRGRFGPPGGGFGGPPGGDRGGFDPSSFLDRLDRNRNGMLDPDEMEGPAQFMVSRLQRDDPSIRTDRPVPMSKLREGFEKMRASRESGSSSDRDRDRDRGRDDNDDDRRRAAEQKMNEAMIAAPLVPGFGVPEEELFLEPVLGFGPSAELMAVEVTAKDQSDAEESLRRYDRNRDGYLSGDEISSRWSGNPMDFDRNGDKKLTLNELAIRTARRRVVENSPEVAAARNGDRNDRGRRDRGETRPTEPVDLYHGRKSYLTNAAKLPEGLPGWFASRDRNGDLQVEMSEYSDVWTAAIVEEFNRFDLNGDGVVTTQECRVAVESGVSASSATASAGGPPAGDNKSMAAAPGGGSKLPPVSDEKLNSTAQKIIGRYDKNGDGALTANEWQTMLIDPSAADADKDGRVTIPEYASWMATRSAR